jgi:hypothetical protein
LPKGKKSDFRGRNSCKAATQCAHSRYPDLTLRHISVDALAASGLVSIRKHHPVLTPRRRFPLRAGTGLRRGVRLRLRPEEGAHGPGQAECGSGSKPVASGRIARWECAGSMVSSGTCRPEITVAEGEATLNGQPCHMGFPSGVFSG